MEARKMRKELANVKGLGAVTINRIMEHFEKNGLLVPSPQYAYSWEGEYYNGLYNSIEEAIKDAKATDENAEEVYIGVAVKHKYRWHSNEEQIIESMQENLYEDCGEFAEGQTDRITNEQEIELGRMIDKAVGEWVDKYDIKPTCYTVTNVEKYSLKDEV